MKSNAARNGGASNTGTGYLPFTNHGREAGVFMGEVSHAEEVQEF